MTWTWRWWRLAVSDEDDYAAWDAKGQWFRVPGLPLWIMLLVVVPMWTARP